MDNEAQRAFRRARATTRDLTRLARNPKCPTLRLGVAARVDFNAYLKARGAFAQGEQSPFALAFGNRFESRLHRDGELLKALVAASLVPEGDDAVLDLSAGAWNEAGLKARAARTADQLNEAHAGARAPRLMVHPVLPLPLGSDAPTLYVVPDALVRIDRVFRPVEIKSFPDLGARTDKESLRAARLQAAVQVLALRAVTRGIDPDAFVPPLAVLVLGRAGSLGPRAHVAEDLEGEIHQIETLAVPAWRLGILRERTLAEAHVAPAAGLDGEPVAYTERCASFCPLARSCRDRLRAERRVELLGDKPAKTLAPLSSIDAARAAVSDPSAAPPAAQGIAGELAEIARLVPLRPVR